MKRFFVGFLATVGSIVLLAIALGVFFAPSSRAPEIPDQSVLYLRISGNLPEYTENTGLNRFLGDTQDSLYDLISAIDAASGDDRIQGIVVYLDSLDFRMGQTQEIRSAIARFKKASPGKFTLVYADSLGEFGNGMLGYYLASVFDHIVVQPQGMLGTTGLYFEIPFVREAFNYLEIKPSFEKRKEYKSAVETFTEKSLTKPGREALELVLTQLMDQVVTEISASREIAAQEIKDLINRSPLTVVEAKANGLIDEVAYLDQVHMYVQKRLEGTEKGMRAHELARGVFDQNDADKGEIATYSRVSLKTYLKALPAPPEGSKVALIYATGLLLPDSSNATLFGEYMAGSREIANTFQQAIKDPDVAVIVLRMNSEGGSPSASETIWRAVMQAKKAAKPVIVSMGDVAASGGYWASTGGTKILANPGTITGSIGVYTGKFVTKRFWQALGVQWENAHVGDNAGMWSSSEEFSHIGAERLKAMADDVYETFIARVVAGRNLPREHVQEIAKGRIWSGVDAQRFGLVDGLGGLYEAIELAKAEAGLDGKDVAVQVFPEPPTFAEKIGGLFSGESSELNLDTHSPGIFSGVLAWIRTFMGTVFSWGLQAPVPALRG